MRKSNTKGFKSVEDVMCKVTAGGSVALVGYSNQEETVWGMRTDLRTASIDGDLAVCVTLQLDLPGRAARGRVAPPFGKVSFSVCRQVALVGIRGDVAG